jgi:hypothetical protein
MRVNLEATTDGGSSRNTTTTVCELAKSHFDEESAAINLQPKTFTGAAQTSDCEVPG